MPIVQFAAVILAGIIQIVVGLCRLGRLIRMVPHSVELGFVNDLAIVICMAQFGRFKAVNAMGQMAYLRGPALWIMMTLIGLRKTRRCFNKHQRFANPSHQIW